MAALADSNALPSGFGDYMIKAITSGGPFGSQKQQKELVKIALERELAQIISCHERRRKRVGPVRHRSRTGFQRARAVKTASVSVKPQGNEAAPEGKVLMIRQLVAGAIGCKPTDVSVADLNTDRTLPGGSAGNDGGGLDNAYAPRKQKYEKQWEREDSRVAQPTSRCANSEGQCRAESRNRD